MGDRTVIVKPVPQTLYFLDSNEQTSITEEIKQKVLVAVQEPSQQFHAAVAQLTLEREEYGMLTFLNCQMLLEMN